MESAADWPPPTARVPRKPKVAQFCAAPWPNFTPALTIYLASQPVDFRKGPDSLLSPVRDAGRDPFNGALYVFRAKRADRVKIVCWEFAPVRAKRGKLSGGRFEAKTSEAPRRVPVCEAAGAIRVLLAADRAGPGAAQPRSAGGADRGAGLETGAPRGSESPCICGLIRPRRSESPRLGMSIARGMARRDVLSCAACAPMIFPNPMTWTRLQDHGPRHGGEDVGAGG